MLCISIRAPVHSLGITSARGAREIACVSSISIFPKPIRRDREGSNHCSHVCLETHESQFHREHAATVVMQARISAASGGTTRIPALGYRTQRCGGPRGPPRHKVVLEGRLRHSLVSDNQVVFNFGNTRSGPRRPFGFTSFSPGVYVSTQSHLVSVDVDTNALRV